MKPLPPLHIFRRAFSASLRIWMGWRLMFLVTLLSSIFAADAQQSAAGLGPGSEAQRFVAVDVVVETGQQPLAAYQLELTGTNSAGSVKMVGIEGGEPVVFRNAPYYDPAAMQGDRVVIGAFSTAPVSQLPQGGMRIATVHCLISGEGKAVFTAKVSAAAAADGQTIPIQVTVRERNEK